MKKFLVFVVLSVIVLLSSYYTIYCLADGTTDAMYLKFTTPQQSSLVIGGSRAAQGLQPTEINGILNRKDVYNYAFQNPSSPYGDIYLNSIKRKLKESVKNGLFILEVNPWNMTVMDSINGETDVLTETDNFLANTQNVTSNPNLEYLVESFTQRVVTIFQNRRSKGKNQTYLVEDDGWLHLTIKPDSLGNFSRRNHKIKIYTEKLKKQHLFSEYRGESLAKLIDFLKDHGDVYLVRMPIHPEMLSIENKLVSNFDDLIETIAEENSVVYINKMPSNYKYSYVDGHHLDVRSGREFSIDLANTIKNNGN